MLNIRYNAATERLLDEIDPNVKNQILLVPEPLSHETERLLQGLGDNVGMYAEALTFQRIAHRVLVREGGLAAPQLDAGGRLLLLARAVGDVRANLKEWGRVAGNVNFLTELMATIDELKLCDCKPEMLVGTAKFEDLRLIWDTFEAHVFLTAADPRDLLTRVAAVLYEKGSIAVGARLYVDGFVSFTAQEYAIIRAFLKHGEVTVALAAPRSGDDTEFFIQPRKTAERLKRLAAGVGVGYTESFDETVKEKPLADVFACADMLSECAWAAETVTAWVSGEGLRFDDIAVATPAWSEYRSVLLSAFARAGIPVFADDVTPVTEKSAARFILSSLETVINGFEPDDVIALIKTGLSPISADECFILEDYIRTHNMRGVFWTMDKPWAAHPAGWGARVFSEADTKRLETLNRIRETLRVPLLRLRRAMSQKDASGEDYARALYGYCEDMKLAEMLAARCEYLTEQGAERTADEYRQLWGVIVRALDNFVEILGDVTLKSDEFARLFELCMSQYSVGVIPLTLNRLQVCALDRLYRRGVKRLLIVGANEQYMPKRTEAQGLLTDEERVMLEENGIHMAPDADERASRELFTIHSAFGLAEERLTVSYNTAGKAEPSIFVGRLGVEPIAVAPQESIGGGVWHSDRSPLRDGTQLLSAGGTLSASRLESYNSCRWAYFSRYALKLKKRGAAGPAPKDAGSMLHKVLEVMVKEVMARGGFHVVERGEALELAKNAADEWLGLLPDSDRGNARVNALTARLKNAAVLVAGNVYDELSVSEFEPLATEHVFTTNDSVPLTGIIDRIDGWIQGDRLYIRVVDYKSGRNKFSLSDVWYGLGMQMLCYMFALDAWNGREASPAGVLYMPAHDRYAQVGGGVSDAEISRKLHALLKRTGIILNDPEVIAAMEKGDEKLFIPVKFKQDGSISDAYSQVATAAELGLLRRHVTDMMQKLSESLTSGQIDANPVCKSANESHCDYCDFAEACYFDDADSPRFLDMVGDFWERVGQNADAATETGG